MGDAFCFIAVSLEDIVDDDDVEMMDVRLDLSGVPDIDDDCGGDGVSVSGLSS